MLRYMCAVPVVLGAFFLPYVHEARAGIDVGSDGSDGAFSPSANHQFNLSLAASDCNCDGIDQGNDGILLDDPCRWDCPSPVPMQGVYDAEQWAIVFKWTSIDIPAGVTVTFPTNHYSRAPVVWLSEDNVTITGTINVNGAMGSTSDTPSYATPGPGGFRGGRKGIGSANLSHGFGPGGGIRFNPHAAYATVGAGSRPTYGNAAIIPLIGGSGGAGSPQSGGSAGGGAILVASNTLIALAPQGRILAGGAGTFNQTDPGGAGSGGAIRLVADGVSVDGLLYAGGGTSVGGQLRGGDGRIRVEGNDVQYTNPGAPLLVEDLPTFIFPPSSAPKLRAVVLGKEDVPLDPKAIINDLDKVDMTLATLSPVPLQIEAENVPPGTQVTIRVISASGTESVFTSPGLSAPDPNGIQTDTQNLTFGAGYSVVIMRASFNPTLLFEARPKDTFRKPKGDRHSNAKTLNGERIARTEVISTPNGRQQIVYVTETGRHIPVGR